MLQVKGTSASGGVAPVVFIVTVLISQLPNSSLKMLVLTIVNSHTIAFQFHFDLAK